MMVGDEVEVRGGDQVEVEKQDGEVGVWDKKRNSFLDFGRNCV